MKRCIPRANDKRRLKGTVRAFILLASFAVPAWPAAAQTPYPTEAGDMLLFESGGATRLVEHVRSAAQGVIFAIFVKPGDAVRKGQLLGHAELEATKLQLDLARQAMESKANVDSARSQAEAWTVTREETELAVRKRKAEESRLEWAIAMEKKYHADYETQLAAEDTQRIQYEYWNKQYQNRFFRAPVDGVVSEVLVQVGQPVNFATHLFTIRNESTYALPVTVPAELASAATPNETLPVRSADGQSVSRALVDSVIDDPRAAGRKIIRLLLKSADLSSTTRANLGGMKFDVLLPQLARQDER